MIHGGPMIVLREDRGGPPRARVDAVVAYLKRRASRQARVWRLEAEHVERERRKPVPCVYCGAQTELWERPAGIGMCSSHFRSMSGRFPFRLGVEPADLEPAVDDALYAARKALYVFEKLVRQEEIHARNAG